MVGVRGGGDVGDAAPGAEYDRDVRIRIAHGLRERGHVGDVVGVARRSLVETLII